MKIDLKVYVSYLKDLAESSERFEELFTECMINNDWFGIEPEMSNGVMYIDTDNLNPFKDRILDYIYSDGYDENSYFDYIESKYRERFLRQA